MPARQRPVQRPVLVPGQSPLPGQGLVLAQPQELAPEQAGPARWLAPAPGSRLAPGQQRFAQLMEQLAALAPKAQEAAAEESPPPEPAA